MDILLFLTALLILLLAGCGLVLLLVTAKYTASVPELLSLCFLFGVAFVSLTTCGLGLFISGATLRVIIALACLATGAIGIARRRRQGAAIINSSASKAETLLLIGLVIVQAAMVIWWSLNRPLGHDGFAIWDLKARGAYLNGGAIPLSYFFDPTRIWSHPEYPLCLPLVQAWFYGWLGRADQGLAKLFFPLFYIAALGLLYTGGARLGGRRWQGLLQVLLVFFVPFTKIGDGSASSAYADFPLAVFYLAAVIYLIDYWKTKAEDALHLLGCVAAVLPWVKQDGSLLWLYLMAFALIKVVRERQFKSLVILVLPGAFTFVGWNLFARLTHAHVGQDFLPFTLTTLWANLGRGPEIFRMVSGQMTDWSRWSLLWPGVLLALPLSISSSPRKQPVVLLLAVVLPVILYPGLYLFSAWSPFTDHVHTSLPRLFLQVSLVAILIVGLAVPLEIVKLRGSASHKADPAPANND